MWKDKIRTFKLRINKLHIKLSIFYVLLVCVIMLVETYRYNSLNILVNESEEVFNSSEKILYVNDKVDELKENYENFLVSKDKKEKKKFEDSKKQLNNALKVLQVKGKYTDNNIKSVNLYNMTKQYMEHLNDMIFGRKKISNNNVNEATKLYQYIQEYSNEIMGEQLEVDTKGYRNLKFQISKNNFICRILSLVLILLAIICIVLFSNGITIPLKKLIEKIRTVAGGNYNLTVYHEDAGGEVGELYDNFNIMTQSIRDNVDEIKRSRILEQALAKEKINNLNMQKALKEAEYTALQSQVNPHFIFNTINIGSQLAMLNEDDKTCEYLQNAAELFRYNLNGLNYNMGLDKELQNVDNYISVMQTRYGDTIEYTKRFDNNLDISEIILPKMTLQPLVEFLYINSVNSLEDGGMIKILVNRNEKSYIIDILSSGKEIEQKVINSVMLDDFSLDVENKRDDNSIETKEYYMSIIGVKNAIRRIKLLYERKDVIFIRRDEDINYVTIKIPMGIQLDEI